MMRSKTKIAAVVFLTAGMLTGTGLWTYGCLEAHALAPAVKSNEQNSVRKQNGETIDIRGIVVDPDGKPFSGAKIYFLARHRLMQAEPEADFARVRAITDGDGRFRFRAARIQVQPTEDEEVRFIRNTHGNAVVTAVAAGHGLGWTGVRKLDEAGHLTLKLAKDDVPLRGRVVDLEGRPIQGVKARVMLVIPLRAENLQPWLDTLPTQKKNGSSLWRFQGAEIYPEAAGVAQAAVTDADGRFQLRGIGRERVAKLRFEGPTIETRDVFVRTRPGSTIELPYPSIPPSKEKYAYYGAVFEHAAAPTVPIVGTVRDKDTGKPLAGIILQARIPSAEGGPTAEGGPAADYLRAVSDKDGRYRLIGLPKRPGQIIRAYSGSGQSFVRLGNWIPAGVGLAPVRVDFALKRGVLIRGRVTDKAAGQPVQAEVEYFIFSDNAEYLEGAGGFREGSSISTWTDADGSFSVVGLPRRGIVAAKVWWAKADRYIVAAGAEQIKGASRHGLFLTYPFVCHPERFHCLHEVNPAKDAASVECNFALDRGKTITGLVLGPDGQPLTGVRVEGPRGIRQRDPQRLKTSRFTVTAINPKAPQWVFFLHKEKQLGAAIRLTGNEPNDFAVRLQPCATISGRVVDSEGKPRAGLQLAGSLGLFQTNPSEGGFLGARTGKDGCFRVTGLIPGLKWRAVHVQEGFMLTGQLLGHVTFQAGEIKDLGDLQVKPFEDDE